MKKDILKEFPKKAKLISDGGLYRIIDIENFAAVINFPIMRRLTISTPEVFYEEDMKFLLKFQFLQVKKGYAEYKQIDFVKLSTKD
jgi:hypothetical protein